MAKAFLRIVAVLAFIFFPREVFAEPRLVRLEYIRGPEGKDCPNEAAVRNAIAAQMGYDPFSPDAAERLVITIAKGPKAGKVEGRAELSLSYATGRRPGQNHSGWSRQYALADCDLVIASLALAIADELEPWPAPAPATPAAPAKPPTPASPPPEPPPSPLPASAPRVAERASHMPSSGPAFRVEVAAGGAATLGMAPAGVSGHVSATVGLRWRYASLSIEGEWQPDAGADLPDARLAGSRYGGAFVPCGHVLVFFGCGVAQLGAWIGSVEARVSDSGPMLSIAAGGRLGVQFPVFSRFALAAYGDLLGMLQRPALLLDDQRLWLHQPMAGAVGAEAIAFF
jgi:hypothetical protein